MTVQDKNGLSIQVTNLDKAIAQVKEFTTYRHEDGSYKEFDKERQAYWQHLLKQLTDYKNKK